MSKVLLRRFRRQLWGGRTDVRMYADGSARVWVDHPSNDPAIELAMGGAVVSMLRRIYAEHGVEADIGPIHWRDDPPRSSE